MLCGRLTGAVFEIDELGVEVGQACPLSHVVVIVRIPRFYGPLLVPTSRLRVRQRLRELSVSMTT